EDGLGDEHARLLLQLDQDGVAQVEDDRVDLERPGLVEVTCAASRHVEHRTPGAIVGVHRAKCLIFLELARFPEAATIISYIRHMASAMLPWSAMKKAEAPSFRPLYEQIKILLTQSLVAGEWKPGDAIPSEFELAARFRVS